MSVRRSTDLTASEKLIARCLLDFVGNNASGWPSVRRLVSESSLSESTVRRSLRSLRAKGYLNIEARTRRDGSSTSNLYMWNDKLKPDSELLSAYHRERSHYHSGKSFHERPKKKPNEKHVCCLDQASKEKPAPKRFIKFADRSRFNSFSECEKACDAATSAGFLKDCESDRLVFWTAYSAICRRLKAGKVREPARLLRFLIDSRPALSSYGTDRDEAAGFQALKNFRRQALPS